MESFTVERTKLQKLQHTLFGAAVAGIVLSETVYIIYWHVTVADAVLHGLLLLTIATVLVQLTFRIIYQLLSSGQRRLRESLILLDIATALGSTRKLSEALQLIARRTAEACQAHRCSIFLWDERQQHLLPLMSQYASGLTDKQQWERFLSTSYARTTDEVPILKQVLERRQPLVLDADAISSLPESWARPFSVRALLLVPLVSRDRVTGFMALDQVEPGGFEQDQINLAMTIGSQASAALENARLFEQLGEKARRLTLLAEISMAVTSTLERDAILNTAAEGLRRLFTVGQCGIVIVDEESAVGRLAAESPPRGADAPVTIPLQNDPVFQRILTARQAIVVEDAEHDPLLLRVRQGMLQRNIQSALIVPLLVKSKTIGVIGLGSTEGKRVFTAEEIELAQTIANQISVAMDNAELYQQRMNDISTLKEVDQLKSNLVSNVSHELRAPLTSIKAYTELLLAEAERSHNGTCQDWLTVIDRETDRLTGLITDYLNLSRLESGHFRMEAEPLGLANIVAEVVSVLEVQAKQRHITIGVEPQPSLPELWGDRELIRVAVRNLVSNAIKFSHDGGQIHIAMGYNDGSFKFSIQDEGPGIPEDALPHLFDKFFRVPATNGVPGTGMGLALAREAVMAHGGRIEVESTAGKGSRFTVTLPGASRRVPQANGQEHT